MENIKLSSFKGTSRFKFIDGLLSKVEDRLQGAELEFYNVDLESINKIQVENEDNYEFLYKLAPTVSNIDMDMTYAEFAKMCMYPSVQFSLYIEQLLEHYKNMFLNAKKLIEISNKSEDFIKNELGKDINIKDLINKVNEMVEAEKIE